MGLLGGSRLECCTFCVVQGNILLGIWSCDPSNISKFNAYEYLHQNLIEYVMDDPTEICRDRHLNYVPNYW